MFINLKRLGRGKNIDLWVTLLGERATGISSLSNVLVSCCTLESQYTQFEGRIASLSRLKSFHGSSAILACYLLAHSWKLPRLLVFCCKHEAKLNLLFYWRPNPRNVCSETNQHYGTHSFGSLKSILCWCLPF